MWSGDAWLLPSKPPEHLKKRHGNLWLMSICMVVGELKETLLHRLQQTEHDYSHAQDSVVESKFESFSGFVVQSAVLL